MTKKARNATIISLLCIAIVGILMIKNSHPDETAMAIENKEAISEEVEDQTQGTQGQAVEVLNPNPETTTELTTEQTTEQTTETTNDSGQGSDEETTVQDEQKTTQEDVSNDETQHIDINMEDIIALVGEDVYNFDSEKISPVSNPSSLYVLVNKKNNISSDYVPADLVIPNVAFSFSGDNPKKQMRAEAASALEDLFQGALDQGLNIYAVSGYRSYSKQETIYNGNVSAMGQEAANKVSAVPGQSEHQTGLAMDISSQSAGFDLVESFGDTVEGQWLAAHAHEYGFIVRYPKDKTDITGYNYEPWHVRYVGVTLSKLLYEQDITLEQFYEQLAN